ncbi:MAG: hypothetical protein ACREWG_04070 [Gammaproteobacteria bacterium]
MSNRKPQCSLERFNAHDLSSTPFQRSRKIATWWRYEGQRLSHRGGYVVVEIGVLTVAVGESVGWRE